MKKVVAPCQKRELVDWGQQEQSNSIERACKVVCLQRSMWYYRSKKEDTEVIEKLQEYAQKYPTSGFDEYYGKIRSEDIQWNRKRVLRVYRSLQLKLKVNPKREYRKELWIHFSNHVNINS